MFIHQKISSQTQKSLFIHHLVIEKMSMKGNDLSSGSEVLHLNGLGDINANITLTNKSYTPPGTAYSHHLSLSRKVLLEDLRNQKLNLMPGFRLTWHCSEMEVEPWVKYDNKAFIRNSFRNILYSFQCTHKLIIFFKHFSTKIKLETNNL